MKNLFLYLVTFTICFCFTQNATAQQISIDQPTPEYQAAGATNLMSTGEFATVGNSSGSMQFFQHLAGPTVLSAAEYFHPTQQPLEVIDMVFTEPTCGFPEGYFVTGNVGAPAGTTLKHIFVARLDAIGTPLWYKEFPISFDGTAKAITTGMIENATPNLPEANRVYVLGMSTTGITVAASLDHCGTPAWGPFTYNTPNSPTFPEDIAFQADGGQVMFTGAGTDPTGVTSTWISGVNASTGMTNWTNLYPVYNGNGDQGTAVAVDGNDVCVTGRATFNNDINVYTLKVDAGGGTPLWQNIYVPMTSTSGAEWGEDITASATPGHFTVIARDATTGNTFIHDLDASGFPIAASQFIYPLTVPSVLRDQLVKDHSGTGYYISSNTASNSGDYHGIWTAGGVLPMPCGPLDFPVDFFPTQSYVTLDAQMDFLNPWEDLQIFMNPIDLLPFDPCIQDTPCEVMTDFCFEVDNGNVTFNNGSTGNGVLTYEWDFGDGNTSTAINPAHSYPIPTTATTYIVCLSVKNTLSDGTECCYTCCKEITIFPPCYNNIPGPTFNYNYKNGGQVKFNNPSGVGGAFTKEWTIDGVYYSNLNQPPSLTMTPGFHTVCLEVTKNSNPNCSEKFCREIWVDVPCTIPTTARFKYASCLNSTAVTFDAIAGGTSGSTDYKWDFGDGNTASGMNATHTYSTYGTYMVCLTIENTPNCSKTICAMIEVSAPSCTDVCPTTRLAGNDFQDPFIDKLNEGTELQIMPNPIQNVGKAIFSEIQTEKATITISDLSGRTISQASLRKGDRNYEFDVSELPSGMYIITLQHPDGKMTSSKIIKE